MIDFIKDADCTKETPVKLGVPDAPIYGKGIKLKPNLINDGRLAGLIDWYSITDRTRNLRSNSHWDNPADVIASEDTVIC